MKLVARKGQIRRQHFAHHRPTVCDGGPETILHRLAKETLRHARIDQSPGISFRLARNTKNGSVIEIQELVVPPTYENRCGED